MSTKIEWCDETLNPVTGCAKVPEGCQTCYAERMAKRLAGRFGYPKDDPFKPTFHPERLKEPLRWKNPRIVFVCSMGDLFHEKVPDVWVTIILGIMRKSPQHFFIILTKRPKIMAHSFQNHAALSQTVALGLSVENQARAAKALLESLGKDYYIKEDLRKFLD